MLPNNFKPWILLLIATIIPTIALAKEISFDTLKTKTVWATADTCFSILPMKSQDDLFLYVGVRDTLKVYHQIKNIRPDSIGAMELVGGGVTRDEFANVTRMTSMISEGDSLLTVSQTMCGACSNIIYRRIMWDIKDPSQPTKKWAIVSAEGSMATMGDYYEEYKSGEMVKRDTLTNQIASDHPYLEKWRTARSGKTEAYLNGVISFRGNGFVYAYNGTDSLNQKFITFHSNTTAGYVIDGDFAYFADTYSFSSNRIVPVVASASIRAATKNFKAEPRRRWLVDFLGRHFSSK